nr:MULTISPECIES: AbgT family transporter [Halomonas]
MIVSTFVVTLIGDLVTERIVEPKLGKFDATYAEGDIDDQRLEGLTDGEKRALKGSGLAALTVVAVLAIMVVPEWGGCATRDRRDQRLALPERHRGDRGGRCRCARVDGLRGPALFALG